MESKSLQGVTARALASVIDREGITPDDLVKYVDSMDDFVALLCLDGVCLHSPDSRVCLRDTEIPNVFDSGVEEDIYTMTDEEFIAMHTVKFEDIF